MSRTYGVKLQKSDSLELERHSESPVGQSWKSWVAGLAGPIAVDLFCGAGGLSLGLEAAGCTVALSVDVDERSLETHRANFPGRALAFDLGDEDRVDDLIDLLSVIDVDILAGGPPCQPFSRAGRSKIRSLVDDGARPAHDVRKELWRSFVRVAAETMPRAVLLENVPDLALGDDSAVVREITKTLEDLGYSVDYRLVDAWKFGVPQHRQRLILVGMRDGDFVWPQPSKQVDVRSAIGDLPSLDGGTGARTVPYERPSKLSEFQRRARTGVARGDRGIVHDHMTRPVRTDDREAFELMDASTTYSDLPDHLRRYRSDIFNDKYNRLGWDQLSRSITAHIAKDGYWYIHPSEPRTLTVREAARIQTFPDRFRFAGTRSHAFAQIGNAVPPALAEAIARGVLDGLDQSRADGSPVSPSRRRELFRTRLNDWPESHDGLWLQIGDPWSVLVSTICGRRGAGDGHAAAILDVWGAPSFVDGRNRARLLGKNDADTQFSKRVRRVELAGRAIRKDGWSSETWETAAELGPAASHWVRAVGLEEADIADSTGIARVANRFEGFSADKPGSASRLRVAQLIGWGKQPISTTVAMAALAETCCRPTTPDCHLCPLVTDCRSAQDEPLEGQS